MYVDKEITTDIFVMLHKDDNSPSKHLRIIQGKYENNDESTIGVLFDGELSTSSINQITYISKEYLATAAETGDNAEYYPIFYVDNNEYNQFKFKNGILLCDDSLQAIIYSYIIDNIQKSFDDYKNTNMINSTLIHFNSKVQGLILSGEVFVAKINNIKFTCRLQELYNLSHCDENIIISHTNIEYVLGIF